MSFVTASLLTICAAAFCGLGVAVHWHSRREKATDMQWFQLVAVPNGIWGPSAATTADGATFLHALGLPDGSPRPLFDHQAVNARQAEVFSNLTPRTAVGVPAMCASKVRCAAAGCGILAIPAPAPDPSRLPVPLPAEFPVHPAAPWKVGLSTHGSTLPLNAVPGTTIAVLGASSHTHNVVGGISWPEELVSRISCEGEPSDLAAQWREAWDPNGVRIVTAAPSDEQLAWVLSDQRPSCLEICERLLPGIVADIVLVFGSGLSHSLLIHRDHRLAFTPLTYRSTGVGPHTPPAQGNASPQRSSSPRNPSDQRNSASLRTARVASARAASSSSSG